MKKSFKDRIFLGTVFLYKDRRTGLEFEKVYIRV